MPIWFLVIAYNLQLVNNISCSCGSTVSFKTMPIFFSLVVYLLKHTVQVIVFSLSGQAEQKEVYKKLWYIIQMAMIPN